jgi:dTDP-4-dehydrorhamnose 3,5-epimerase
MRNYKMETIPVKNNPDERGNFREVWREDWFKIKQANVSFTRRDYIRAWHRHNKGQTDYLYVLSGRIKLCIYDGQHVEEMIVSEQDDFLIKIPGNLWHGYKALEDSKVLYFVTRLYNYDNPDEERRPYDDKEIGYKWI